jgi:flagellar motor switch protein FliN/FliY
MMVLTKEKIRVSNKDGGPPPPEVEPGPASSAAGVDVPVAAANAVQNELPSSALMKLSVPLSVRVAERSMRVRAILDLTPGSIVEFDTPASSELDLLANNRLIARGVAVKVGEKFGLKVTRRVPPSSAAV